MNAALRFRHPRHIASAMLLVWLLALLVSWANACLLQPTAAPAGAGRQHVQGAVHAADGHAQHAATGVDGSTEADAATQACISFCDAEQSTLAKSEPSSGDLNPGPSGLAMAALDAWLAFTAAPSQSRWRHFAALLPPGPPVAIAFLRLTL